MVSDSRYQQQPSREADHHVVAALLSNQGRIGLFRRSTKVTGDVGLWHCVTGYLGDRDSPLTQALVEVEEEVGISREKLQLSASATFDLLGEDGFLWRVHAFHFLCQTDVLTLNWENDAGCWVHTNQLHLYPTVTWLDDVFTAVAPAGWSSKSPFTCSEKEQSPCPIL